MKKEIDSFENIFTLENLVKAFKQFQKGKKYKSDIALFEMKLFENLNNLHQKIVNGEYKHGPYFHFVVNDPKKRDIHKASVSDRVLHHLLYDALYVYFDNKFIHDSYSCRINKGTHRAMKRFQYFSRKESKNFKKKIWILKCDVRKCFASVDHHILKSILSFHIKCSKTFEIVSSVIDSFNSGLLGKGIPLGNLTSQIFINIYLNNLDQYIKRELKIEKYIRYADDFILMSRDFGFLESTLSKIQIFLKNNLKFEIRPDKVFIKTLFSGVDFLGWVHFPKYMTVRTKTKKRILKEVNHLNINSYIAFLSQGDTFKLRKQINQDVLE